MRGHTIHQERISALGRWGALRPEIVVVASSGNDLTDLVGLRTQRCRLDGAVPTEFAEETWSFAGVATAVLSDSMRRIISVVAVPLDAGRCREAGNRYRETLVDLHRGLGARGSRLVFAPIENMNCGGDPAWNEPVEMDAILSAAAGADVPVTDLRGILHDGDGTRLGPVDSHPSPLGHRRLAEALSERLSAQHILDRCRQGAPDARAPSGG